MNRKNNYVKPTMLTYRACPHNMFCGSTLQMGNATNSEDVPFEVEVKQFVNKLFE